ncbi:carbohydrate-binding protein [Streptomyces apocyni]|uniref:carbohydrate-binding protein n=1 Tax=Streptomyces apocyni TaxID=2654677 RepID=UPI0012EAD693|nr:carbohydrate-binding protein [Streptomyces apocyni]
MTPGDNGASKPEDDDPFGYLYADGQAAGATPPGGGGGYGYPGSGRSHHQVRTVGERQYGQPPQAPPAQGAPAYGAPAYGAQIPPQQALTYDQAHYAAPETFPGGPPVAPPQQPVHPGPGGQGGGRGPNTKMLLIGALAVVAAVVIGISVAMLSDKSGDENNQANEGDQKQTEAPAENVKPSDDPSKDDEEPKEDEDVELPQSDANSLSLLGGAITASDIDGAKATGGTYVTGLNTPGASATWTVNKIPKDGKYTLNVNYGVPGKDANTTLTINGKAQDRPLNMKNFAKAKDGDWEKGWTHTWSNVMLTKGTNTIKISCEAGNSCDVNLDQVALEEGWRS